jgi:hypothetical protein
MNQPAFDSSGIDCLRASGLEWRGAPANAIPWTERDASDQAFTGQTTWGSKEQPRLGWPRLPFELAASFSEPAACGL